MAHTQTYKNHSRQDPLYHFFVLPVLLLNIIAVIVWYTRHHDRYAHTGAWAIVVAVALFLLAAKARAYALKAQDRTIALEERLRLAAILPAGELVFVQSLSVRQLIALRFASDAELPALALRAATEGLGSKQIKESITVWRSDTYRV